MAIMNAKMQNKKLEAEMVTLNRASDSDLEAFAGAEDFANGSRPFIGHFSVEGCGMTIVAGGSGMQVVAEDSTTWQVADHQDLEFLQVVSPDMSVADFTGLCLSGLLFEI
jgi:hypothetical protein